MHLFEPQLIDLVNDALKEDIKGSDITTDAFVFKDDPKVECTVITKSESAVICGLHIFRMVFDLLSKNGDNGYEMTFFANEGDLIFRQQTVISVKAKASVILYAERTALNFLQHLSGIATAAHKAQGELAGLKTRVLDTRKTIPGLRLLQKYAVKTGGAENHRFDLSSGVLIKDNHIKLAGGIKNAVKAFKTYYSGLNFKIEIEAENIEAVNDCLEAGVDIIMLDNMNIEEMKRAVKLISGRAITEASGNISMDNLRKIAEETGVDYISMGSLTNSVSPVDFSLNF